MKQLFSRIEYNAPVILTLALASVIVLIASQLTGGYVAREFFAAPGSFSDLLPVGFLRLFSHILGHSGWPHLIGNFMVILLIGPLIEGKYGSKDLFWMITVTAVLTAILNAILFTNGIMGASGVVFMLILLGSFSGGSDGKIPLTFLLVAVLYLGREIFDAVQTDSISQFAHIFGGLCGTCFGLVSKKRGPLIRTSKDL